jgi:hypothetical protein
LMLLAGFAFQACSFTIRMSQPPARSANQFKQTSERVDTEAANVPSERRLTEVVQTMLVARDLRGRDLNPRPLVLSHAGILRSAGT